MKNYCPVQALTRAHCQCPPSRPHPGMNGLTMQVTPEISEIPKGQDSAIVCVKTLPGNCGLESSFLGQCFSQSLRIPFIASKVQCLSPLAKWGHTEFFLYRFPLFPNYLTVGGKLLIEMWRSGMTWKIAVHFTDSWPKLHYNKIRSQNFLFTATFCDFWAAYWFLFWIFRVRNDLSNSCIQRLINLSAKGKSCL